MPDFVIQNPVINSPFSEPHGTSSPDGERESSLVTLTGRRGLPGVLCSDCLARLLALPDAALLPEITTPPAVPPGREGVLELCRACLSLHRSGDSHDRHCAFGEAGLTLAAGGWESGLSRALRADLRRARPSAPQLTIRVFAAVSRRALEHRGN